MKRFMIGLVLALCYSPASAAELRWIGDAPVDAFSIGLRLTSHSAAQHRSTVELAQSLLASGGYYWPRIISNQDIMEIDAGPRGQLGTVRINGMGDGGDVAAGAFRIAAGGRATEAALKLGIRRVVEHLVAGGFPFAQVQLHELDVTTVPQVDVVLVAYPGAEVYTGELRTDATRTRPDVFVRETGWVRGMRLSDRLIRETTVGLQALPFVSKTDSALLVSVTADTADMYVAVREAAGVRVAGLVGWVPTSGPTQQGYWGGAFEMQLLSPFGDGRAILLSASRRDPDSRRTELTYWEPWPWGAPVWVGLSLDQDDFGRDFIESRASLRLRLARMSPRWELHLGTGRVTIEEEPSPGTFSGNRYEAGVSVTDSTVHSWYRFGVRWNRQRLDSRLDASPVRNSIQYTRAEFGVARWFNLSRSLFVRVQSDGAGSLTGAGVAPPNLLHRVGGLHTLRGYREEEFLVRDYLRSGLEWHAGSRDQSVYVFVEAAWLRFTGGDGRVIGSAGLGLRVGSQLQLLFAVPSEGGAGASKIHIGLSTSR